MLDRRDFLPDSEESSSDEESNPHSAVQPVVSPYSRDTDIQRGSPNIDKGSYQTQTSTSVPKRQSTPPGRHVSYNSDKKPLDSSPKLAPILKQPVDLTGDTLNSRPGSTESSRPPTGPPPGPRPPSASAAMRANMMKKQREQLLAQSIGSSAIKPNENFIGLGIPASVTNSLANSDLDRLIGSVAKPDPLKSSQVFSPYEPGAKRDQPGTLPAPVKPIRAHIGLDSEVLVEEKFDESKTVKRPPSRALQEIHRKSELELQEPKYADANYWRGQDNYVQEPKLGFQPPMHEEYESFQKTPGQYAAQEQPPPPSASLPLSAPYPAPHPPSAPPPYSAPLPQSTPSPYSAPLPPSMALPHSAPFPPSTPLPTSAPFPFSTPPYSTTSLNAQSLEHTQKIGNPAPVEVPTPGNPTAQPIVRVEETQIDYEGNDRMPRPPPPINLQQVLRQEMADMRRFLTRPVPQGINLQCVIRRDKSGFKRLAPRYYMNLSCNQAFLLAGKKKPSKTSHYILNMNKDEIKIKSPGYLGYLRSNFMGTEFNVYDSGPKPKKKMRMLDNVREQLGVFMYVRSIQESNLLGSKGPRKMKVLIPVVNSSGDRFSWCPLGVSSTQKHDNMQASFNSGDASGIFSCFNKPPKWNDSKC